MLGGFPMTTQAEKATKLLSLHHASEPLVLVNAWDSASACIVEQAGFPAVATTSAGVANALGYSDGQHLPWAEMEQAIRKIVQAVKVPVTADIEAGFGSGLQELEATIQHVIEAGAVGINLEDALPGGGDERPLYSVAEQLERIRAARRTGERLQVRLVINARTDAYWGKNSSPAEALRKTLERGRAYLDAGADCIFVPGLRIPEHVRAVAERLRAPVNILGGAGVPPIPELAKMGVKRVSLGSGPMRAAMGTLRRICQETATAGTYNTLSDGAVSHAEMNAFFRA
jgi:2-methylisocitrate lyase-like PEP mutase family enzyme